MNIKKTNYFFAFIIIFIFFGLNQITFSQTKPEPVKIGKKLQLYSNALNEEREFFVNLPKHYSDNGDKYPVLYALDAEWLPYYKGMIKTVWDLSDSLTIPKIIIVGIWNKDSHRNRDMIPLAVPHRPGSGGSDQFLEFITLELMPFIKKNYRTSPYNIIYGGSNAGILALYAFLKKPEYFNASIAGSPMIGHCAEFIYNQTRLFMDKKSPDSRKLYMIYGSNDYIRCVNFMPDYNKYLQKNTQGTFKFQTKIIPNGGHVPQNGLELGLRYIYSEKKSNYR